MKRILVMSDTHGHRTNMKKAVGFCGDADCIIHLGDYAKDTEYLKTLSKVQIYSVRGNCDITSYAKEEIFIDLEGVKILALHGHAQGVKQGLLGLGYYAQEKGADLALFGHTHVPAEEPFGNSILFNPGSLGEPRGRQPSVGIITIDDGQFSIKSYTL